MIQAVSFRKSLNKQLAVSSRRGRGEDASRAGQPAGPSTCRRPVASGPEDRGCTSPATQAPTCGNLSWAGHGTPPEPPPAPGRALSGCRATGWGRRVALLAWEHLGPARTSSVCHRRWAGSGTPGPADLRGESRPALPTSGTRTSPVRRTTLGARGVGSEDIWKHTLSLGPHGHGGHRGGRSPATTSQNQRDPAWRQAAGQAQPHAERAWPGSDIPLPPWPVFRGHLSRETCPEPPPRPGGVRRAQGGRREGRSESHHLRSIPPSVPSVSAPTQLFTGGKASLAPQPHHVALGQPPS